MRTEFLKLLKNMQQLNVTDQPTFRFKSLLLGRLLRDGIPAAPLIVGAMKVEINETFINDNELVDAAVETYGGVIQRAWVAIQQMPMNPNDQLIFFVESMKGLSLTYTF